MADTTPDGGNKWALAASAWLQAAQHGQSKDEINGNKNNPIPEQPISVSAKVNLKRKLIERAENSELELKQRKMNEEQFIVSFCQALVHDHKEDKSIGGGHAAQCQCGAVRRLRRRHADARSRL